MNKQIKLYISLILLLITMSGIVMSCEINQQDCSHIKTSQTNIVAPWEYKTESSLWNEKTEYEVLSGKNVGVNSFCTEKVISDLQILNDISVNIVNKQNEVGVSTSEYRLALFILSRSCEFIKKTEGAYYDEPDRIHIEINNIYSFYINAILNIPLDKNSTNFLTFISGIILNINLKNLICSFVIESYMISVPDIIDLSFLDYLWDKEKIDPYGLFFYIRDNSSCSANKISFCKTFYLNSLLCFSCRSNDTRHFEKITFLFNLLSGEKLPDIKSKLPHSKLKNSLRAVSSPLGENLKKYIGVTV